MKSPYYNDQKQIADQSQLEDEYVTQMALLAFFKIDSYKLAIKKPYFHKTKEEIRVLINDTLLNYTDTAIILSNLGFFQTETEN